MGTDRRELVADHRLISAYQEANRLDDAGVRALCPSCVELSEFIPRYRDESPLGEGATKTITRIYDSYTQRWVAMARPKEGLGLEHRDDFVLKAWLTSSLNHPNIIKIYDIGVDGEGVPFFTMDLKSGITLSDHIGQGADLSERLEVFTKVCDAVAYAHSRGVLHLDLKPANIQVDRFGEVLVCDWGLGQVVEREEGEEGGIHPDSPVRPSEIQGTPGYMAPEQATPHGDVDARSDIFALGCILYKIITGALAFNGSSREEILTQTREGKMEAPRSRFPERGIPQSLEAVVLKAAAHDPGDRYAKVGDLKRDITKYLTGYATSAEDSGFLRDLSLFVRRNFAATVISLTSLITLTVLIVLSVQGIERQRRVAELAKAEVLETERDRAKFAKKIAGSCKELREFNFMTDPVETHEQFGQLVDLALAVDPECREAYHEQFRWRCLQMDFSGAAELLPKIRGVVDEREAMLAEACRDFAFSKTSRPSVDQLLVFMKRAQEVMGAGVPSAVRRTIPGRALSYDFSLRQERSGYDEIVKSLILFLNPDWNSDGFRYDGERGHLELKLTSPELTVRMAFHGGRGHSALWFLDLKSLKLITEEQQGLFILNKMNIETLDLRDANCVLKRPVRLPELKMLYMRKGQFPEALIREVILTDQNLEVVDDS